MAWGGGSLIEEVTSKQSWGRLRIQPTGEGDGVQSGREELQEQRPRDISEMTSLLANAGGFA